MTSRRRSPRTITAAVLTASLLALAGCSTDSTPDPAPASPDVASSPDMPVDPAAVGTGGELIAIASSNVQAAGYDDATAAMTVLFDSGGLYEYYAVPPDLWTAFVDAQPHPWSAVGYPGLVQGGYAYQRLQ